MLDVGWWELAVIGMVALIVVGPGELPALLRTIGRYVGMAKRQADEFRSQFDEAIRESEFDNLRKEMDTIKSDVKSTLDDAQDSVRRDVTDAYQGDEYDWDKDGSIKPAPEFADDLPTTSFTTADGEVISKTPTEAQSEVRPEAPEPTERAVAEVPIKAVNGNGDAAHAAKTDAVSSDTTETDAPSRGVEAHR